MYCICLLYTSPSPRDTRNQESPETLISGSGHFVRCHQSYWVNLKHVQAIGSNHFTMDSGSGIPISRTYLQEAKQRFLHELIHI